MSKVIFNWKNFPVEFLNAVLQSERTSAKYRPQVEFDDAHFVAPYLHNLCKFPDEYFVNNYREEIENYFLSDAEHLANVAKDLESKNYAGIRNGDEDALRKLKQCKLSNAIITAYLDELLRTGADGDVQFGSSFYQPVSINLANSHIQDVKLYSYQQEANVAMQQYFLDENGKSGILVMPTGSGKTMTSIYFLLHLVGMKLSGLRIVICW